MSLSAILYLAGMALIFVGERLVDHLGAVRWILDAAGAGTVIGSGILRVVRLRSTESEGLEKGHRTALALTAVGGGSILLYVLYAIPADQWLGLGSEAVSRWDAVWGTLWPTIWLIGTLPLFVVDHSLRKSPVVAPHRRVSEALSRGLTAALGLALVFPLNFLGARHDVGWNLAYFKTAHPGSATRSIVESVSDKVHVYVFLPPNSAVLEELESYFDSLTGPKLELHRVDQTARPRLARELSVRSNGKIVFSTEEVTVGGSQSDETSSGKEEKPGARITESMQIATKLDQAREDLKDLDQKVQKRLLAVSSGNRVAYLTTGHGELSTGRDAPRNRRLQGFKRILEAMSFRVDKLGVGQGLAEGVPDDADLVAIIGPTDEFLPSEIEALKSYLDRGGSLLLAMEPPSFRSGKTGSGDKKLLTPLLDKLGVSFGEGVLAAESGTIPLAHNKTDKLNVVTNRFSSHPSTATLSKHATALFVFTPSAGYFELDKKSDGETTTTVRSPSAAWADVDGDFKYESDAGESRKDRAIAVAANGEDEKSWRALATADATLYSDLAIGNRGNQQFVYDGVNWLIGAEALSGGVQSEEDVKIRHTKEGQAVWFYGTVFAVPLLLLAGGGLRIWRRRKRHEREA